MNNPYIEPLSEGWETHLTDMRRRTSKFSIEIEIFAIRHAESSRDAIAARITINGKSREYILRNTITKVSDPLSFRYFSHLGGDLQSVDSASGISTARLYAGEALFSFVEQLISEAAVRAELFVRWWEAVQRERKRETMKSIRKGKIEFIKRSADLFQERLKYRLGINRKRSDYHFTNMPEIYEILKTVFEYVSYDIKQEKGSPNPQRRANWRETIRDRSPLLPEDILEFCEEDTGWNEELHEIAERVEGRFDDAHLLLEWTARRSSLEYEL